MQLWDDTLKQLERDIYYNEQHHSTLKYDDIVECSRHRPPASPLEFPAPLVYNCDSNVRLKALDHRTGLIHEVKNVIMRKADPFTSPDAVADRAYLLKKKLSRSTYGSVRLCVVLVRRKPQQAQPEKMDNLQEEMSEEERQEYQKELETVEWESTEELVALKISSWRKIEQLRGRHLEDPIREIAAMQHIGDYHPHILGCSEVLQDRDWLYTITPYCSGGDLYGRVLLGVEDSGDYDNNKGSERSANDIYANGCVNEKKIRHWFKQLLLGLYHLQRKGACHRDISLENIMLDKNDNVVIVDLGLSLRVPYCDANNTNNNFYGDHAIYQPTVDISEGTCRLLMKPQGQCGNLLYNAPEIINRHDAFDGYAIDLWSVGIILFVLLLGFEPFKWANITDKKYEMIANGKLHELLKLYKVSTMISPEAVDLIQNMLRPNPADRLSLYEVMHHPWVTGVDDAAKHITTKNGKENYNNMMINNKYNTIGVATGNNTEKKQKTNFFNMNMDDVIEKYNTIGNTNSDRNKISDENTQVLLVPDQKTQAISSSAAAPTTTTMKTTQLLEWATRTTSGGSHEKKKRKSKTTNGTSAGAATTTTDTNNHKIVVEEYEKNNHKSHTNEKKKVTVQQQKQERRQSKEVKPQTMIPVSANATSTTTQIFGWAANSLPTSKAKSFFANNIKKKQQQQQQQQKQQQQHQQQTEQEQQLQKALDMTCIINPVDTVQ